MAAARVYLHKHETLIDKPARIKNHCILNIFDVLDTMVLYSAKTSTLYLKHETGLRSNVLVFSLSRNSFIYQIFDI